MENTNSAVRSCWTVLYPSKQGAEFAFERYSKMLIPGYVKIPGDNCVKYEVRNVAMAIFYR